MLSFDFVCHGPEPAGEFLRGGFFIPGIFRRRTVRVWVRNDSDSFSGFRDETTSRFLSGGVDDSQLHLRVILAGFKELEARVLSVGLAFQGDVVELMKRLAPLLEKEFTEPGRQFAAFGGVVVLDGLPGDREAKLFLDQSYYLCRREAMGDSFDDEQAGRGGQFAGGHRSSVGEGVIGQSRRWVFLSGSRSADVPKLTLLGMSLVLIQIDQFVAACRILLDALHRTAPDASSR